MELVNQVLEDQKGKGEHREGTLRYSKCGQQLLPLGMKEQKEEFEILRI